jgi:hypothetical protein
MSDAAKPRWTAGPHCDSVYRQVAVLRDKHRRQIFYAYAGTSGNDDDVGICLESLQDGVAIVANQAREVGDSSITLNQRCQHGTVRIRNVKAFRP